MDACASVCVCWGRSALGHMCYQRAGVGYFCHLGGMECVCSPFLVPLPDARAGVGPLCQSLQGSPKRGAELAFVGFCSL